MEERSPLWTAVPVAIVLGLSTVAASRAGFFATTDATAAGAHIVTATVGSETARPQPSAEPPLLHDSLPSTRARLAPQPTRPAALQQQAIVSVPATPPVTVEETLSVRAPFRGDSGFDTQELSFLLLDRAARPAPGITNGVAQPAADVAPPTPTEQPQPLYAPGGDLLRDSGAGGGRGGREARRHGRRGCRQPKARRRPRQGNGARRQTVASRQLGARNGAPVDATAVLAFEFKKRGAVSAIGPGGVRHNPDEDWRSTQSDLSRDGAPDRGSGRGRSLHEQSG